jgi:hypothetical protein
MSEDRESVEHRVVGVVHHIDHKQWSELRQLFADTVTSDYVSLFGGSPVEQPADSLVDMWRQNLGAVTTQHLLGPLDTHVTGDRATSVCHVRALHYAAKAKSGTEWEVLGHYVFELSRVAGGFRITKLTLETFHQRGNRALMQEANT